MTGQSVNLSQALVIFENNLDDIMDSLAINLTDTLESLPPVKQSDDENLMWVRDEVRKLKIEQITEIPLRVIRRIQSRKYYQSVEGYADRITDEMIISAKEVDIGELFDGKLRKQGNKRWAKCPFHGPEKTPSFCLFEDNRYKCFGCQLSGDSIDFIMQNNGVQFIQAVKILCQSH